MRVRRDISSIPLLSASETWRQIINLITGQGSKDSSQMEDAAGVMASIISDEHPASRAILIEGVGPQLRIYCRYGMKAVEKGAEIDALTWNPTAGDWTMHVPCDEENLDWVRRSLENTSPRIKVFDSAKSTFAGNDASERTTKESSDLIVNWNLGG